MTLEELKRLIADDEGETLEVKESTGQRRDACETLCAFLNKDGGTVVFGVSRKGKLTGQLMADTTKRDLFDAFQKFDRRRTSRFPMCPLTRRIRPSCAMSLPETVAPTSTTASRTSVCSLQRRSWGRRSTSGCF